MRNSKKKILVSIIFLFTFGMAIFFVSIVQVTNPSHIISTTTIRSATPETSFTGIGGTIAVSLHQSYINDEFNMVFTNLDDSNGFSVPCPTDLEFSLTNTYIEIEDINAPDRTLIIEDHQGAAGWQDFDNSFQAATSFFIMGNGYLENISVYCRNAAVEDDAIIEVNIWNAIWNITSGRLEPGTRTIIDTFMIKTRGAFSAGWYNLINQHHLLLDSNTDNHTWYIGLRDAGAGNGQWAYIDDDSVYLSVSDNLDETFSIFRELEVWRIIDNPSSFCPTVDLKMKLNISPINATPSPSDINLEINGIAIEDNNDNTGILSLARQSPIDSDGDLDFKITSNWVGVSLKITKIQVNYVKIGLNADTIFKVEPGIDVMWIASVNQEIDSFDSRLEGTHAIKFIIPSAWYPETIKVYHDTNEITEVSKNHLSNGYTEVIAFDAGNGLNWYLTANSDNLLSPDSIKMYVEGKEEPSSSVNYSDIVEFLVIFLDIIESNKNNAIPVVLQVHRSDIESSLIYSIEKDLYSSDTIVFDKWNISSSIADDYEGELHVQVFWHDDKQAAFGELVITIESEEKPICYAFWRWLIWFLVIIGLLPSSVL